MQTPGSLWTAVTTPVVPFQGITYGNVGTYGTTGAGGLFVAVASSGSNQVYTSSDGITWATQTAVSGSWRSVTYGKDPLTGNGRFVALAEYSQKVMWSDNGTNWSYASSVPVNSNNWYNVTYGNNMFVAVSYSGTNRVMYSSDGKTWSQPASTPPANTWYSVAYGGGYFVAVSNTGAAMYASDPTGTWTSFSVPTGTNAWQSVTYGNGKFVAVARSGTYYTMTWDGIVGDSWQTQSSGVPSTGWLGVTYGNGMFVAVAFYGPPVVMVSTDGVAWTSKTAPSTTSQWQSVVYGNGVFAAVGYNGSNTIMWSSGTGYSYPYTATKAIGSTFIDGTANVTIAPVNDLAGNTSSSGSTSFVIDTTAPTASISYSSNNVKSGTSEVITATFSRAMADSPIPQIAISGANTVTATNMTKVDTTHYTYTYTVGAGDGTATVALSAGTDLAGNLITATPTSGATFTVDNTAPTAAITYSITGHAVKSGNTQVITATFSEAMKDSPIPQISISGANTVAATNMTKVDTTHYTYSYVVGTGDGTDTVALGTGTDLSGNLITATPTSGATFTVDNTGPTAAITYSITGHAVKSGNTQVITAAFSEPVADSPVPQISISGANTVALTNMTKVSTTQYTYSYTVGSGDGTDTVALGTGVDSAGNTIVSIPTSGATFTVDNTGPTVALTYSKNPTSTGTETITAGYSEAISGVPTISIDQPGTIDISNQSMNAPGISWATQALPSSTSHWSIAYGNNTYVAISDNGIQTMTSSDGINWATQTGPFASYPYSITYGNGLFVVFTGGWQIYTSPDGLTWTVRNGNGGKTWRSAVYANNIYVAVGDNGGVETSPNGVTWTSRTAASSSNWRSVTYGNGLFVAVSNDNGGPVMTSPDGINWTSRTGSSATRWYGVVYGNGLFVAVGYYPANAIMTSTDGINWTTRTSAFTIMGSDYKIDYGNGLFVAVGGAGTSTNQYITSANGINWTARTFPSSSAFWTVFYGNGTFFASPYSGSSLFTSPSGYYFNYTVNKAVADNTYKDGVATVSLSTVTDLAGNNSGAPTGTTFTIDTTGPTVALTYAKSVAGVGTNRITATYTKALVSAPTISIDQPGSVDITNATMTNAGGNVYTYDYTVVKAIGTTYVDGVATVSLSPTTDALLNASSAPTNNTFTIDTANPTAAITYSLNRMVKTGDLLVITATFNKPMADTPAPKISISGANTLASTDMTKVDTTHYTYTYTVTSGTGTATVALGTGTDVPGNLITSAPTSGTTFSVDNNLPTSTITSICSTSGNGCTTLGALASPQESYKVLSIKGTVADTGGSLVNAENISIKDTTTNKYYSAGSFSSATEVYTTATLGGGNTTWSYDTSAIVFTINDVYQIHAQAVDGALNNESPVQTFSFKFANSPPTVSNITASENSSGSVNVSYDVADIESSQTTQSLFYSIPATLSGSLTSGATAVAVSDATYLPISGTILVDDEMISYTSKSGNNLLGVVRGAISTTAIAHNTGVAIYVKAVSASGAGVGLSNIGTAKNITWLAKTDASGYQNASETIKVVANDGSVGNMIGSLVSSTFVLDAASPTVTSTTLLINNTDSSVNSTSANVTLKLQNIAGVPANENIFVQFSRDGGITYYGANANGTLSGAGTMGTGFSSNPTTISTLAWPWTMQSRTETITVKITDSYSNYSTDTNIVGYNAAPEFNLDYPTTGTGGLSVSQISDSADANYGKVKIQYSIRDTDTAGDTIANFVTPTFSYKTSGSWNAISDSNIVYGDAPTGGQIIDQNSDGVRDNKVSGSTYYTYTAYWTAPSDIATSGAQFKVDLNDLEPINNTASQTISNLIIDTTKPIVTPVTFDAGLAGVNNSATITIPMPTDMSAVQYRIMDDVTQTNPRDTDWQTITSSTTIPWTFDSDIEAKTIKYQFRDIYGNTTDEVSTSTLAPIAAASFYVQDASNISIPYYDMYIGWKAMDDTTGFASYKLEYATSTNNIVFGSYNTIGASMSDAATNYFLHRGLNSDLYYRYRIAVVGQNGNISVRAGSYTTVKPDGVQNYGEGGGGSIAQASKVENVVPSQGENKNVTITYRLTDPSFSKKTNASYEGRIFYNIGITLPTNAFSGDSLTVSDASHLASAGYIQINNEVIKYTSKTGNILSGLTRGTWPNDVSSGRTTRENLIFFAGTPVWIMANGTTPVSIVNTSIATGQDGSIVWNASSEINLAGNSYNNVGIKVLIHDNQDGMAGPLSSQNDYSENGILSNLDLNKPAVYFGVLSSEGDQSVSPVDMQVVLGRPYPQDVTVDYTVTGTAVGGGVDYTLSNGTLTIPKGETTANISAEIILQTKYKPSQTIIVTLSNPTNAIVNTDNVYNYTITNNISLSTVAFDSTGSSGTEVASNVNIPVSLSSQTGVDATVDYTVTGTAVGGGVDYTLSNGTLTIPAGSTTANISAAIISNLTHKPDRTIVVTLSNPSGATLGTNTVYTYTILDNQIIPTVSFANTEAQGFETVTPVSIAVNLSTASYQDTTVDYTVSGTAVGGVNYTLTNSTLIIGAGQTSVPISLGVLDSGKVEGNKTVVITLSNPTHATLGTNTIFTYTILNDHKDTTPPELTLNGDNPMSVTKGDTFIDPGATALDDVDGDISSSIVITGTVNTNAVGTYTRTYTVKDAAKNITTKTRTVNVTLATTYDIIATPGLHGTITPPGTTAVNSGANQTYTITPDNGFKIETLIVDGASLATAGTYTFTNVITSHTITATFSAIYVAPTVAFEKTTDSGISSIGQVNIPVSLSGISNLDVTVNYKVTGTAVGGGVDYTLSNGILTIPAGEMTANITALITNVATYKPDQTIVIVLSAPVNAILGANNMFTYTITNNANTPIVGFDLATSSGPESVNSVLAPISISSATGKDVTVDYSVTGGTAVAGVDFVLSSGTATVSKGDRTTAIPITIIKNTLYGENKTIIITLSNPTNATLGDKKIFTYTIVNDNIQVTQTSGNDIKSTSAVITWTTADFTDSKVEYGIVAPGTDGAYNLSKSKTDKVLSHRIYLGGLTPSTKYYFKTTSTNIAGESTSSESDFTTTAGPILSGVATTGLSDTSITITWNTDIASDSYVFYGLDESLVTTTKFGNTEKATSHSVTLTKLNSEKTYFFYVQSTDADSNIGEDANDGSFYSFTTSADATGPDITKISVPIITADAAAVVWTTNEGADGQVSYGLTQGSYSNSSDVAASFVTNHLITLGSLTAETTYYFVIKTKDSKGNLTTSNEQSFTTAKAKDTIVIGGGGGGATGVLQSVYDALQQEYQNALSKLSNQDSIAPVISNVNVTGITSFSATVNLQTDKDTIAFIKVGKDLSYGDIAADDNLNKTHAITLHGLTMGTDYHIKASAVDKYGNSTSSEDKTFKTKYISENMAELKNIDNIEQFQNEIESTIASILPSLVAPFIEKPSITDITESSATISFKTNVKSYPVVSYATDALYDATKDNPYSGEVSDSTTKSLDHTIKLVGLSSNTKYHIMAKAFSLPQVVGKSEDITFTTEASKVQASITGVKNNAFTVIWTTDEPTSSIVEYKNLKTGISNKVVDDSKDVSHSINIENLTPGTDYEVSVSGINALGNLVQGGSLIRVRTSIDVTPPVITNIKVDNALVAGRADKVQTIISWITDEPSDSTVYYQEGSGSPDKELANKQVSLELTKNHTVILTSFKPGTVYRFQISSTDSAGNMTKPPIRTIITPRQNESIVDVIFKNFDDTFNFMKNVGN